MNYTLMHKDIPVLGIALDDGGTKITRVGELYHREDLPVGVPITWDKADRAALNAWWTDRFIPSARSGLVDALSQLGFPNPQQVISRNLGLSLSDHYWIKPADSNLSWNEVNFFENAFSPDVGDTLLGKLSKTSGIDLRSPDWMCDGNLRKRWAILDGKRCLVKAGSGPFHQQPFNEVIASTIAERLGIPHVPYTLLWEDGMPYSVCENFVTPNSELIPAWRVMQFRERAYQASNYQHYCYCCEELGLPNVSRSLDQMIVLDYLIANEDRHLNNFGLLRDPDTLDYLGPAPLYDSGSSLGYNKLTPQILSGKDINCKPFKRTHQDQLRLVTSFDWLDLSKLDGVDQDIREVFTGAEEFIDKERVEAIVASVNQRVQLLATFILTQQPQMDSTENDVEENVAAEYGMKL